MKCTLILFSPTGGTEKAARLLCEGLGTIEKVIDLADQGFTGAQVAAGEDTVAVIAMPSFGGRVPPTVPQRLGMVQGNGAPCVVVAVYGNRAYDDTLKEMELQAKASGFRVAAAVGAVAEHSIARQVAAGRPDAADAEKLREMGRQIAAKLAGPWQEAANIPGKAPQGPAKGMGMVPKAGSGCNSCGLCAQVCPTGAIDPKNIKTGDKAKCITCMRCVAKCPQGARGLPKVMAGAAGLGLKLMCATRKECELYL